MKISETFYYRASTGTASTTILNAAFTIKGNVWFPWEVSDTDDVVAFLSFGLFWTHRSSEFL